MGDDGDDGLHHSQSPPFLPDELISHILSWLPVRSLFEFKRVCKLWETLISDHQFANNHLRNLNLNPSLTHRRVFCSGINDRSTIISFPVEPLFETPSERTEPLKFNMEHKFRIIGSCNGLLCMFDKDQGYVKLLNPCIRFKFIKSPTLDCYVKCRMITYYGFGYDHVNDKYKVLLSLRRASARSTENVTQIYTFGENCWTTVRNFPYVTTRPLGKFVSGTLNWLVVKTGVGFTSNDSVILSFDLEKETYKELLLPEENDGVQSWNHILGVLNNCLCVCFGPIKAHWNLWVMKKYGVAESWTKLTVIKSEQLRNCVQYKHRFIKPLLILENHIVLLSITTKFVLLNLNNGRLDKCLQGSGYIGNEPEQHIYYASLVSPQL